MSYLKERVSYLRGLADGMKIDESTNEGKLLKAIIEVLDDVSLSVEDLEEVQEELSDQVDSIDEDLAEIERIVFDEDECCEDEEDNTVEIECPHCNEEVEINLDEIDEDDTVECPNCHEKIEIEWDCDCGEHHHHEE